MKKDHFLTNEALMLEIYSETIFDDPLRIRADIESISQLLIHHGIFSGEIVDLGCGPNLERLIQLAGRFPGIHFSGWDHSSFFVQVAKERYASEISAQQISVNCGVLFDLADESVTGFTVFGNMISCENMSQNEQLLSEMYRCLAPGGFCLLQLPDMKIWQRRNPTCSEEFVLQHTTEAGVFTEEGKRTFNAENYISEGTFVYKDHDDKTLLEYATRNQLFDFTNPGHAFSVETILARSRFSRIEINENPVACSPKAAGLMSCLVNITCFK